MRHIFIAFIFFYLTLMLPSNFIVSGVKSSKQYPVLISKVIVFSILFISISIEGLIVFPHSFLIYTQNNLEYLI